MRLWRRSCGAKTRVTLVFIALWIGVYVITAHVRTEGASGFTEGMETYETNTNNFAGRDVVNRNTNKSNVSVASTFQETKEDNKYRYQAVLNQMEIVRRQIIALKESDVLSPTAFDRSFNVSTLDEDSLVIGDALIEKTSKCTTFLHEFSREKTVVPYVAVPRGGVGQQEHLCLVTTISHSRMSDVQRLLAAWPGCINLVVYLERGATQDVLVLLETYLAAARARTAVHLVYAGDTPLLPINFLRNLAALTAPSDYVLYIDADLSPSAGLHETLMRYIHSNTYDIDNHTALIIPAFSLKDDTAGVPQTKSDIVDLVKHKKAEPFYLNTYKPAYGPTNYEKWMSTKSSYDVNIDCYAEFEPYMLVRQRYILYKEIFVQRFINKVIYFTDLCLRRYRFVVEPGEFITHMPHKHKSSSLSWMYGLKYCAYTSYKIHYRLNRDKYKYRSKSWVVKYHI